MEDLKQQGVIFLNLLKIIIPYKNKITSCWDINGNGICCVKKTKKKEWNERLNILKNTVNYWKNEENKTNKTIEVIELFYDKE